MWLWPGPPIARGAPIRRSSSAPAARRCARIYRGSSSESSALGPCVWSSSYCCRALITRPKINSTRTMPRSTRTAVVPKSMSSIATEPAQKEKSRRSGATIYFTTERFAAAALPRSICTSYLIFWPSFNPPRPARSTAEMCTNTSLPPSSGWIKPKPFWPLNHLTVPVAIVALSEIGGEFSVWKSLRPNARASTPLGPRQFPVGIGASKSLRSRLSRSAASFARRSRMNAGSSRAPIGCLFTIGSRAAPSK